MLSKWLMVSPSGHSKNSCPSKSFAHSISAAQEEKGEDKSRHFSGASLTSPLSVIPM